MTAVQAELPLDGNTTTFTSAKKLLPFSVVQCQSGSPCEQQHVDAVTVSGSHNVFVRYEPPGAYDGNTLARYRVVKGDLDDQMRVVTSVAPIDGLLTLQISTTKKTVEVVVVQKEAVQRVMNEGSGVVVVMDQVVVTTGPSLAIAVVGSGDVFVASTAALMVDSLTLHSKGSGLVQVELTELRVSTVMVEYDSSGDIVLFTNSVSDADRLVAAGEGSGSACLSWGSPFAVTELTVQQVGSGAVSIGPMGSCQQAKVSLESSGQIDIGGMRCDQVDVELLGSGDVVLQAVDTLSGAAYGSGSLRYSGEAPRSIVSDGYKHLNAKPVDSEYLPVHCKQHKPPVLKSKAIGVSTGVFAPVTPRSMDSVDDSDDPGAIWSEVANGKDSIIPLSVMVFLVALVLRWFNESRRRAREVQRRPLLGGYRRVYV